MSSQFQKIFSKLEHQQSIFKDKSLLDTMVFPQDVVGREEKIEEILKHLIGYKRGYVEPLISVFGRSGSGKSTLTKLVCENFDDAEYVFVNLRKAKTVFGSANQILSDLGEEPAKSAKGLNAAIDLIGDSIMSKLKKTGKKLFILVLDEIDVLFNDVRGKPSDFVYKLLVLEEKLRTAGIMVSIIAISNNLVRNFELDDRVRSRIGTCEVFFEPYKKDQVLDILRNISEKAFSVSIDDEVLQKCADVSSAEHGDARRAIELLKISSEIASFESVKIIP
ncbi:MAG: AAA family ATPase [Nitrosopumilus sp.]|nr:AAA family ATPase [Nitrosopumilus sp.]